MSKATKFFTVTNQMMIAYEYNQWQSLGMSALSSEDSLSYHNLYLYKELNGNYALLNNPVSYLDNQNNNILNTKFGDQNDSTYYYLGYFTGSMKDKKDIVSNDFVSKTLKDLYNNGKISALDTDLDEDLLNIDLSKSTKTVYKIYNQGQIAYDTIRVYLLTGFVFNNISGMGIKVKAKTKNNNINNFNKEYVTLLNYIFFKDRLQDKITWLSNPLYMNSKFYDRYIEISVPDAYYLGTESNKTDSTKELINALNIDSNCDLYIEFSTISDGNIENIDQTNLINTTYSDLIHTSSILLDPIVTASLKPKSNSDLFNLRIYEDSETHNVIYYPVFGEGNEAIDFNIDIMMNIENGRIPLVERGFYDNNEGYEEFTDEYGLDACRWVIINELSVTYEYKNIYINENDDFQDIISTRTQIFTNTIDYTNKTSSDGQFWRSTFIPNIPNIPTQQCQRIIINYICRLQNRLNGAEVIRSGGLTINDPKSKYNNSKFINVSNINTWKIVNRIEKGNRISIVNNQEGVNEKYIRSYYNSNDIIIQDVNNNITATQGQLTLRLFRSTTDYAFKLYDISSNNTRIPHNLSGPYKYKLIFPTTSGVNLEISPKLDTKETTTNLGIGSLLFTITDEQVKEIMKVAMNDRYFAIICDSTNLGTNSTTLYEGNVAYY